MIRVKEALSKNILVRGVLSASIIYPLSCTIQQGMEGKTWDTYDSRRCFRYMFFGMSWSAPVLTGWFYIANKILPKTDLKNSLAKSVIQQFTFGPFVIAGFFFWMSLLEGKTVEQAIEEVKLKFFPTWKVGCVYFPIIQTLNFAFISHKNRVVFVVCSNLIWVTFLAYMKHQHFIQEEQRKDP